jgi:co-chaperonin GroES (HSP10)
VRFLAQLNEMPMNMGVWSVIMLALNEPWRLLKRLSTVKVRMTIMVNIAVVNPQSSELDVAFPELDFGIAPTGSRVLVQIRRAKKMTKGGIHLSDYDKGAEADNTQVAKVVGVGPLAFRNRNTMELWPEGAWYKHGDFVFVPKYAGARWRRDIPGELGEKVEFVIFNDLDIVGTVTGNPLSVQAYI